MIKCITIEIMDTKMRSKISLFILLIWKQMYFFFVIIFVLVFLSIPNS